MPIHSYKPISDNVAEMIYNEEARTLSVRFHAKPSQVYVHANVPPEVFTNAQKDWSAGKFYHAVVKRYGLVSVQKHFHSTVS